jgi:hypothetical protein
LTPPGRRTRGTIAGGEELDAYVSSEVRRQLKPRSPEKKIPIDPSVKNFFRGMSAPAKEAIKLSDYERTLKKASSGKSKPVPQLGEQPNQQIEPLVTGEDFGIQEFINDTELTADQLLRGAPIEKAEVKYMYELGKPLSSLSSCSPYPHKYTSSINYTWK